MERILRKEELDNEGKPEFVYDISKDKFALKTNLEILHGSLDRSRVIDNYSRRTRSLIACWVTYRR